MKEFYKRLGVYLFPGLVIILFLIIHDPFYEIWKNGDEVEHRNKESFWSDFFYYKWTAFKKKRSDVDVIILGDSRADQLSKTVLVEYKDFNILNLGIPGYDADKILHLYQEIRKTYNGLIIVVINVDNFYRGSSEMDILDYLNLKIVTSKVFPYQKYLRYILFSSIEAYFNSDKPVFVENIEAELLRYGNIREDYRLELSLLTNACSGPKTIIVESSLRSDLHENLLNDLTYYSTLMETLRNNSEYSLNDWLDYNDFSDFYHVIEEKRILLFNSLMDSLYENMLCN